MKKLQYLFTVLAFILSHIMCIVVAWGYRDMLCGIDHMGYSTPAEMAFLGIIPFVIGILLCGILSCLFRKKTQ